MAWNPDTYNQFKSERAAPFYDLLKLVKIKDSMQVIDLGCGTGELTKTIADTLPGAFITGIDSSAEMLFNVSMLQNEHLQFTVRTIEDQMIRNEKWDLIFSNAAIQWIANHEQLFSNMIRALNPGGQLAIQMPSQQHNMTNILLNKLAEEVPFKEAFKNINRTSPMLNIDRYATILFDNGATNITAFEKIYPLILPDTQALFHWVSGTALLPYIERLGEIPKDKFIQEYKLKLRENFKTSPVFYAFKRILLHAQF